MAIPYKKLFDTFSTNLKKSPPALNCLQEIDLSPKIGIGYNAQGWDQLPQCIIFPLSRQHDKIVGFYGYPVHQADRDSLRPEQRYVTKRIGFYPRYPDLYTERLLLTESIVDAALLWQIHGVWDNYTVLACYSARGLMQEQQVGISSLRLLREVILFFGATKAGRALVRKVSDQLLKLRPEITIYTVNTPDGETVNTLSHSSRLRLLEDRTVFAPVDVTQQDTPAQISDPEGEQSGTFPHHNQRSDTSQVADAPQTVSAKHNEIDHQETYEEKGELPPLLALRPVLDQISLTWIDQQQQQYAVTDYELSLQLGQSRGYMYQIRGGKMKMSKGMKAAIWHFFARLESSGSIK